MSSTAEFFLKATLVGVGGTIVLDLYALMMSRVLGVPATNWAMVGRWFGNMAHGQFVQVAMSEAVPVKGELAIGWIGAVTLTWSALPQCGALGGVQLLAQSGRANRADECPL